MTELSKANVNKVAGAIHQLWSEMASDAAEIGVRTNRGAMELCLDAGRLKERSPAEGALVEALIEEHGWKKVHGYFTKRLRLM